MLQYSAITVLFDTDTNTIGKQAELCQLAAINWSSLASFSEYVLPNQNIDKYASRINRNLSIKTVDGKRVLFKQSNSVLILTCETKIYLVLSTTSRIPFANARN
jgi:hypothetical protein